MNYLDSKLILYLVVIFFIVFIFIKLKTALAIRNLNNKIGVRFYYKFLGNMQWLKEQILMGKYLEMKYLTISPFESYNYLLYEYCVEKDGMSQTDLVETKLMG